MSTILRHGAGALLIILLAGRAHAAPATTGQVDQQPLNVIAIGMFLAFVALTLAITYWAARRTRSAADFYTAGGGITGTQNGFAIAGDYMSAATLLGFSSLVFFKGIDGFIYIIGFFVGWPIIMFLMAERLRNLGKFTLADIVSSRLEKTPIRTFAAIGSLTVVCFYLIVQMVGAGQLIQLLFGLPYNYAVVLVGVLMMVYVMFGGMNRDDMGADHQSLPDARRRHDPVPPCDVEIRLQSGYGGANGRRQQ